jgi:uncharacterized membrane protein YcaP (DUF421 family)
MNVLFDSWNDILRVLVTGVLAYAGLIVLLRISGNRTLSKMNSFDLVVTIAFGSILASVLLDKKISLADGLMAIALLVLMQFLATWLSVRSAYINAIMKTRPSLLLMDGSLIPATLKTVRVTEGEVHAAIRQSGLGGVEQVAAVIMESDGSLSVIAREKLGSGSALQHIPGFESG